MDEPEELMIALAKLGQQHHGDPRWDVVWVHATAAIHELEAINAVRSRR